MLVVPVVSLRGFTSTTSAATTFFFLIISLRIEMTCCMLNPHGSGYSTPGAMLGSSTSMSTEIYDAVLPQCTHSSSPISFMSESTPFKSVVISSASYTRTPFSRMKSYSSADAERTPIKTTFSMPTISAILRAAQAFE